MKTRQNRLTILSLGFTRDIWNVAEQAQGDTLKRLTEYSKYLSTYHVITHSLKRHRLTTPKKVTRNFWAYATNAYTPVDSWLRMFSLGLRIGQGTQIDVVQTQDPVFTGSVGYSLSCLLKVPLNVCVYGSNPFDRNWIYSSKMNRVLGIVGRQILKKASGIQVDGSDTVKDLVHNGLAAEKIYLKPMIPFNLPSFMDANCDYELRNRLSENGRFDRLVLFVGRLVPQKNLHFLINVAKGVIKQRPNTRFVCVGNGKQRDELKNKTIQLGLTDHILWIEGQPHSEIIKFMASCDLFVLPSLYEGSARVLMEAAAAGKPVVTADVSGANDAILPGKTGYILPVNDLNQFVYHIIKVLENDSLMEQLGQTGRQHIKSLATLYGQPERQIRIWQQLSGKDL